jgi:hypothetical protein
MGLARIEMGLARIEEVILMAQGLPLCWARGRRLERDDGDGRVRNR